MEGGKGDAADERRRRCEEAASEDVDVARMSGTACVERFVVVLVRPWLRSGSGCRVVKRSDGR